MLVIWIFFKMRIFKNKLFNRWAKEHRLDDDTLLKATEEMQHGLYEANLGGDIYKKRISLDAKGKRGGARVIIAFKVRDAIFFVYGFAKNAQDNITSREKNALKGLAKLYFSYSDAQLDEAVNAGKLIEVRQ